MVNIDTVYQRVLALANKEQRGYITPQEFNLHANMAQMEIFEQYFYDIEQWRKKVGTEHEYSDAVQNIQEKIAFFQKYNITATATTSDNTQGVNLGQFADLYKLGMIRVDYSNSTNITGLHKAEPITLAELETYEESPLAMGTPKRPNYILHQQGNTNRNLFCTFYPQIGLTDLVKVSYIRKPLTVSWGYVVVTDKALHDPNPLKTTHFELDISEEVELVYKILKLSGVNIKRDDIVSMAHDMELSKLQQEKQ